LDAMHDRQSLGELRNNSLKQLSLFIVGPESNTS
jgi:hypothetical protein